MSENGHPEGACLRYNTGKVELCYLLSFDGAVDLDMLPESCRGLALWYQGASHIDSLKSALCAILDTLPGDHWRTMCQVSMVGAKKYARGNYLKGSPWSSICNSLLRHLMAIEEGHELDDCDGGTGLPHAGHVAWNCAFLLHCVRNFPEHDDRLRASQPEPAGHDYAAKYESEPPCTPLCAHPDWCQNPRLCHEPPCTPQSSSVAWGKPRGRRLGHTGPGT